MRKLVLLFCFALGIWASNVYAQEMNVRGVVTNQLDGTTLPGVSVVIKGTSTGTSTDINGAYSLRVPQGAVLRFTFIGMLDEEVTVGSNTTINVAMVPDLKSLEEVVVTALGIKRELKSLGYAHQEVKMESLMESRESNIGNALTGKVAGLQVLRSSNGPAGSSKIILRGHSSLSGDNQPLIVVDGMPMNNATGRNNNDYYNPSLDLGSGMGDLNQDDIESVTVLKGPSAAALYGSRAANGVIIITTKKGVKQSGLGMAFSATYGTERPFSHPAMQTSFGQGSNGIYDNLSTTSWGPKIEGQTVTGWDEKDRALKNYDNVNNFFSSGIVQNYNLSFQQEVNKTAIFTSLTRRNDDSYIPGATLNRTNITTRAYSKFGGGDRWSLDAKIQYINAEARNRPLLGHNYNNPFYTLYMLPTSLDVTEFKNHTDEYGKMVWYGGGNQINPYWTSEKSINVDKRDRFLLFGSLKNQITDWLSAEINAGSDLYTTNFENKRFSGSPVMPTGTYGMGKETFFENNFSGLLSARKDNIYKELGIAGNFGANIMMEEYSKLISDAGSLVVPDLFALNNSESKPTVEDYFYQRNIAALYGSLQLNWGGYFFLEGTLRNDWSSTLSPENRSFLYPSVNAALVFNEMLESMNVSMPSWFSYGRLRASYAQVGNSLRPYQLYNVYVIGNDPLGNTTATMGNTLFNPDIKNELNIGKEVGADIRFFNNRLGFDITLYKSNAINQLIEIPMDPTSGFERKMINAGNIQNKGMELVTNVKIIDNAGGFSWSTNLNYSRNENLIVELENEDDVYLLGVFDNLKIIAPVGGIYGSILGTAFLRVEDETSPHFGKLILDANGYPQASPDPVLLGNQSPTALLGITNNLGYKGLSLSFMFDGRFGGKMFSQTNQAMQYAGTAEVTAPGGNRDNFVVEGVLANEDGSYATNNIEITQQEYWNAVTTRSGNLGITEANLYDATNVRLRYINLSYSLPKSLLKSTPFQKASLGVTMNNVWLIKSYLNGVDPEAVYATGTNALGFENAAPPTSKSVMFNLSVNF